MKIGFIGGGNMAAAMIGGLLQKGIGREDIIAAEHQAARQLTLQTFLGAAALAIKDKSPPAELRARVTSKGGTTERGLLALEEGGVKYLIGLAARAAAERAHEMGELFGKDGCS